MMESIEKLRELCAKWRKMSITPGRNSAADEVDKIADEIEREIAERFMELPVDADGVPIRVGDDLKFVNGELLGCEGVDAHGAFVWREEQFEFIQGESLRHVEYDSLEHLLADVSKGAVRYPRERVTGYLEDNNSLGEAVMLDIRDRLRDLMGGDGR